MATRRQFVEQAPIGLAAIIAACRGGGSERQSPTTPAPAAGPRAPTGGGATPGPPPPAPAAGPGAPTAGAATPGAPPTFGTAPGVGPEVTPATFEEAERLVQ